MANWLRTIDIRDAATGVDDPVLLAELLADALEKLSPIDEGLDFDRDNLVEDLRSVETVDDFDFILGEVYDWADVQVGGSGFFDAVKNVWIEPFLG